MTTPTLEQRIKQIEERNNRVELDKAWEVSNSRRVLISILTYVVILLFFVMSKVEKPFFNALVSTVGFLVSTLTLGLFKKLWMKMKK